MLTLYPYQREAVDSFFSFMRETGGNGLTVIPTGGGKSLVMGTIIKESLMQYPDTRIINLAHVPELLSQNYGELIGFWPDAPAGIYSAKLNKRQIDKQILFAGIQSIHRRAYNLQKVDMVLVDEAHLIPRKSDTMYRRFLNDLLVINPRLKIGGFTATAFRLDSGMLHKGDGAMFDDISYEANIRDLIEGGYLCRPVTGSATAQINTAGVGTVAGEFNQRQLEGVAMDPETIKAIVTEIISHAGDRKGVLVFGCGVAHATAIHAELIERGETAGCVFGDTPNHERAMTIRSFKGQHIKYLVGNKVFTTGFNAKHVDLIAVAMATKSTGLWVQIVGRGTRLFPGKENCKVLDFGGNIARHGPIDNPTPPKEKRQSDIPADAPLKKCPNCEASIPISALQCFECGFEFPPVMQTIDTVASSLDIMSNGISARNDLLPEWMNVTHVSYAAHSKEGSPDSLRVSYQCGLMQHREWVSLESPKARGRAMAWWRRRTGPDAAVPSTVAGALLVANMLAKPGQIAVRPNGKHTEVIGHRYFDNEPQQRAA